jgi:phage terminase large subunit GpA-like protein
LTEHLQQTFQHESKAELPVSSACLDTGGTSGYTQAAYDYAKGKTGRRLFAIKGGGSWGSPIVAAPSRKQSGKNARKVDLFIVGVDEAKLTVMRRLNVLQFGPGFCHFPEDRDSDYFKQLTAEKLVTKYVKGFPVREWRKGDRDRNEALDCRVYAFAALKITNPNLKRLSQKMGIDVAASATGTPAEATAEWSKRVAETAIKMRDVMIATGESRLTPVQEEMPPEEAPAPPPQNRRIKRSPGLSKRKGWVQSY